MQCVSNRVCVCTIYIPQYSSCKSLGLSACILCRHLMKRQRPNATLRSRNGGVVGGIRLIRGCWYCSAWIGEGEARGRPAVPCEVQHIVRVGQNHIYIYIYIYVLCMISCQKHRMYTVHIWFWPTPHIVLVHL